jgi:hypothetical protein
MYTGDRSYNITWQMLKCSFWTLGSHFSRVLAFFDFPSKPLQKMAQSRLFLPYLGGYHLQYGLLQPR